MFKGSSGGTKTKVATKAAGDAAESLAAAWLAARGLTLLERNYRVARGPAARGGEIDLILRSADGTLVFCEVRARRSTAHGGAAASISALKQQRIVFAAQHYLLRFAALPPCRFDVVTVDAGRVDWLPAAFSGPG
jgi:putative endonuclease